MKILDCTHEKNSIFILPCGNRLCRFDIFNLCKIVIFCLCISQAHAQALPKPPEPEPDFSNLPAAANDAKKPISASNDSHYHQPKPPTKPLPKVGGLVGGLVGGIVIDAIIDNADQALDKLLDPNSHIPHKNDEQQPQCDGTWQISEFNGATAKEAFTKYAVNRLKMKASDVKFAGYNANNQPLYIAQNVTEHVSCVQPQPKPDSKPADIKPYNPISPDPKPDSEPSPKPDSEPNSNPKPDSKPDSEPSPKPDSEPNSNPKPDSKPDSEPSPKPDSDNKDKQEPKNFKLPEFCQWATRMCNLADFIMQDTDLDDEQQAPTKDIELKNPSDFDKDYVNANAQCPNDIVKEFTTGFQNEKITFSFTPICDFAHDYLRPVILFLAYFIATITIASAFKVE